MYNAPILKKAVEVLRLLIREYRPLGVTEIAKALSISKSTAYGILQGFQQEGFVSKDASTKKYTVGKELMRLSKMVFKGQDLVSVARPFLEKLAELVDETVFLGIREHDMVKIVDVVEAKKELRISSSVGTKLPMMAGATAKVFFSAMSNKEIVHYLEEKGLPEYTERSITDIGAYIQEIEKTRRLGYGLDMGEYLKGIRAIASLIHQDKNAIGAVWLVGFSNSMLDERLQYVVRHLKNITEEISIKFSVGSRVERD